MVFSSMLFLWIFLPLVLAAYYLSPRKIRNGILVFFSLLFYAWGEPIYILLMLCSVLVNFMGGIFMEDHKTHRKGILWGTVLINLGLLGYFKYFNFLAEIIGKILPGGLGNLSIPQVALPIGISFYTFQALSYVIDVYRGEVKAQRNFWYMLLYISFFPQLIAGPIVKYRDIAQQILERKETVEKFAAGVMRFCWGLGKKVLLANAFAEVVDDIFQYGPEAVSRKALWLGAVLYMLQIYYDFSGYSDMAVGLGKMFGFQFQENFDYPYVRLCERILETVAYFPVLLVPGLCVHSPWREQERSALHLPKPSDRVFPYRNVAWRRNRIYSLGTLSRTVSDPGTGVAGEKAGEAAWLCWLGIYHDRGVLGLDPFPCGGLRTVLFLCEEPVCVPWRNDSDLRISGQKAAVSVDHGNSVRGICSEGVWAFAGKNAGEISREWRGHSAKNRGIYSDFVALCDVVSEQQLQSVYLFQILTGRI